MTEGRKEEAKYHRRQHLGRNTFSVPHSSEDLWSCQYEIETLRAENTVNISDDGMFNLVERGFIIFLAYERSNVSHGPREEGDPRYQIEM